MEIQEIEKIKSALRNVLRNHLSFIAARQCKHCNERMKLIEKFAWDFPEGNPESFEHG